MIGQFITAIVEGKEASPNLEDGARIQRILEAASLSHKTGQRIDVDSIK